MSYFYRFTHPEFSRYKSGELGVSELKYYKKFFSILILKSPVPIIF